MPRRLPVPLALSLVLSSLLPPALPAAPPKKTIGKPVPPSKSTVKQPAIKAQRPPDSALLKALDEENVALALALVKRGANPNAQARDQGASALGYAASLGNMPLVRALLERGANVNPDGRKTLQPLRAALQGGHVAVARLLVEHGAQVNQSEDNVLEPRPLLLAAATGDVPLLILLLDKGAEIGHNAPDGTDALVAATVNGHVPAMELLVSRGAPVTNNTNALLGALQSGNLAAVEFLLAHGNSLDPRVEGLPLLQSAAIGGNPVVLQKVLDAGVDINAFDRDGETALMTAARARQVKSIEFLVGKQARLDLLDDEYQTALDIAEKKDGDADDSAAHRKTIAALKKAGAKPAPVSLWRAAYKGDLKQLQTLLDAGADPNVTDGRKATPLYYAIEQQAGNAPEAFVEALLKKGANPNAPTPDGGTLIDAARDARAEDVLVLLRQAGAEAPSLDLTEAVEQEDADAVDALLSRGIIPEADALNYAMVVASDHADDHAILKKLLAKGAKVNAAAHNPSIAKYPLHAAAVLGDVKSVRLLLKAGADPNIHDPGGETALQQVFGDEQDIDAIVRLLVDAGAEIHPAQQDSDAESVLAHLAGLAPAKTLEFLIGKGALADIKADPDDGVALPPLTYAVRQGKVDNVRLLLAKGADPNFPEPSLSLTPLMEVASPRYTERGDAEDGDATASENEGDAPRARRRQLARGYKSVPRAAWMEIAKLLIAGGADLNRQDDQGRNALQIALENGNSDIAQLLRASGSKPPTIASDIAMLHAVQDGDVTTVRALLDRGFDINQTPIAGEPILYEAAFYQHSEVVQLLLARGADVNASGTLGTALHGAADAGNVQIVRLLLAKGATVDTDTSSGTPLARAAEEGHTDVMRVLLKAGADPNSRKTAHPGTPLIRALAKGNTRAVDVLLEAGADPNLGSALQAGLWLGGVGRLERLVRAGADINQADSGGQTVLMGAAALGQKDVVAWLIAHKADVNQRDKDGKTALMYAEERNKTECARLLRKAGAK